MATISNHYILILCGGTGPRLWPLSRAHHPKPFLKLFSANSLLKETFLRAQKIVDTDHIFIISHQKYLTLINNDLGHLIPPENIITEPQKKNTALAILHATAYISRQNPLAVITTFTSDHFIGKLPVFIKTIKTAVTLALSRPVVVTIGIKPTSPNVAFGYLLVGARQHTFYPVKTFIEKPPLETAFNLIKSSRSFWNSGIYTFTADTLFDQFKIHAPRYYSYLKIFNNNPKASEISLLYHNSQNLPFDVVISENSKDIIMLSASFVWSDIGHWESIYRQHSRRNHHIVPLQDQTEFLAIGSKDCLVSGPKDKLIGLVDVKSLAIIDTPDALLICNLTQNSSYHVKDLVTQIVTRPKFKKYFLSKNDK